MVGIFKFWWLKLFYVMNMTKFTENLPSRDYQRPTTTNILNLMLPTFQRCQCFHHWWWQRLKRNENEYHDVVYFGFEPLIPTNIENQKPPAVSHLCPRLYYQSKRYCPVSDVQQGGGQCIFLQGEAFQRDRNRTIPFGLIVHGIKTQHMRQKIRFSLVRLDALSIAPQSLSDVRWNTRGEK